MWPKFSLTTRRGTEWRTICLLYPHLYYRRRFQWQQRTRSAGICFIRQTKLTKSEVVQSELYSIWFLFWTDTCGNSRIQYNCIISNILIWSLFGLREKYNKDFTFTWHGHCRCIICTLRQAWVLLCHAWPHIGDVCFAKDHPYTSRNSEISNKLFIVWWLMQRARS